MTAETSFDFITCHGFHKAAPLTVYLQPFDLPTWLTLMIAMFCLIFILTVASFYVHEKYISTIQLASAYFSKAATLTFYSFSVMLENNYGNFKFPEAGSSITKLASITLAFTCIVCGNVYKSVITTDMIKPIPGTIPYTHFSHLTNFTLITIPSKDLRLEAGVLSTNDSLRVTGRPALVIGKVLPSFDGSFDLGQYLNLIQYLTPHNFYDENVCKKLAFNNAIRARLRVFEYEEDALTQLSKCGKTAFVGSAEEIVDFLKFNRNRVQLVRGKEKFLPHTFAWRVPYSAGGYVHRRLSQMISSGIYHVWEETFYAKTRDELDISLKRTIERKQSLGTNLGALFKIVILAWAFCLFLFVTELLLSSTYYIYQSYCLILRVLSAVTK
jgi:hypothetical protein